MNQAMHFLNSNRLFTGCVMILMNIGSRYIMKDLPDTLDEIFEIKLMRRLVVFAIAFVATHDIKTSLLITLLFILLFSYLLDRKSRVCILPQPLGARSS